MSLFHSSYSVSNGHFFRQCVISCRLACVPTRLKDVCAYAAQNLPSMCSNGRKQADVRHTRVRSRSARCCGGILLLRQPPAPFRARPMPQMSGAPCQDVIKRSSQPRTFKIQCVAGACRDACRPESRRRSPGPRSPTRSPFLRHTAWGHRSRPGPSTARDRR